MSDLRHIDIDIGSQRAITTNNITDIQELRRSMNGNLIIFELVQMLYIGPIIIEPKILEVRNLFLLVIGNLSDQIGNVELSDVIKILNVFLDFLDDIALSVRVVLCHELNPEIEGQVYSIDELDLIIK